LLIFATMTIPINLKNQKCESKASDCVIWSGPDLDDFGIKCGDTITSVVNKLAARVIELEAQLSIDGLDTAALATSYGSRIDNFQDLLKALIDNANG
jgi:hypothetical protein